MAAVSGRSVVHRCIQLDGARNIGAWHSSLDALFLVLMINKKK